MNLFVTGATGYVGQRVVSLLQNAGHTVYGLARNEMAATTLSERGVVPVPGDLETTHALTEAAHASDGVIHTAYVPDFDNFARLVAIERGAIAALVAGLRDSGKPLITSNGPAFLGDTGEVPADESTPIDEKSYFAPRALSDKDVLQAATQGIQSVVLRLPFYVYGWGGSAFVPAQLSAARRDRVARYISDGSNRTSSVHVDDAARAYFLALNAPAGSLYHLSDGLDASAKQIAEAVAQNADCKTRSVPFEEMASVFGPGLATFFQMTSRVSADKARRELGWEPQTSTNLLEDIAKGSYA